MDNANSELERSDESIRHTFREQTAKQQFQQQLIYTNYLTRSTCEDFSYQLYCYVTKRAMNLYFIALFYFKNAEELAYLAQYIFSIYKLPAPSLVVC